MRHAAGARLAALQRRLDPANQNRVLGYHLLLGLRESTDKGQKWGPYSGTPPLIVANNLRLTAAAFSSSGELFIGTEKGLYRLINNVWMQVLPQRDVVDETVNTPDGPVTVNAGDVLKILFVQAPNGHELCWVATVRHIYMCDLASGGNTWTPTETGLTITPDTGPAVSYFSGSDTGAPNWTYVTSPVRDIAGSYAPGQYYVLYVALAGRRESRKDAKTATPGFAFTGGVYSYYVDAATPAPQWQPAMGAGATGLDQEIYDSALPPPQAKTDQIIYEGDTSCAAECHIGYKRGWLMRQCWS